MLEKRHENFIWGKSRFYFKNLSKSTKLQIRAISQKL